MPCLSICSSDSNATASCPKYPSHARPWQCNTKSNKMLDIYLPYRSIATRAAASTPYSATMPMSIVHFCNFPSCWKQVVATSSTLGRTQQKKGGIKGQECVSRATIVKTVTPYVLCVSVSVPCTTTRSTYGLFQTGITPTIPQVTRAIQYKMQLLGLLLALSVTAASGAAVEKPAAVEESSSLPSEQTQVIMDSPQLARIIKKGRAITRGRSFFQTMGDNIMNYLGYGSDDEYDDYAESDYFYPSLDSSALIGNPGSSYSFYNPYGNYQPARDDNFEEEEDYSWGDFMFDAAVVAVPMALVLAAMPTGLFTIPIVGRSMPNNIEETLMPFELPVLRAVEKADFLSYTTRTCQEKLFCEITQVGRHENASLLQKMMYLTASLTPDEYAKSYNLDKLFKSARDGHCESYKCVPLMTPSKKQTRDKLHEADKREKVEE
ncbi:hypothetical protein FHG87_013503 [Trinorchestia longiramus]|nr:hypothetical protein FHG87_013503 [Trinorchestia longiramus]